MKVDTIDLCSNDNVIVSFEVNVFDIRNPYIIKNISGLDADVLVPRFYGKGLVSLKTFYEMGLNPREIVILMGLNPNYNNGRLPSDLRGELYKAISSARDGKVQLRFLDNGSPVGAIKGFVTKFEAPLFSQENEVQLTLRCDDPFFRSLYTTSLVAATLDAGAPVITDPVSTAPHGFKFEATFVDDMAQFLIKDSHTEDWRFQIDFDFETGDVLYFSSEAGDKYLYIDRGGDIIHLMDSLQTGAVWPILFPGENEFVIVATGDFTWNAVYFYETHWGV